MRNQNKTKEQLIGELEDLRKIIAESKKSKTEYKKIEQSLEESREKYKNIAELITDGIITIDLKGVVTSVNNAFLKLTGFPRDKIAGRHFSKLPTLRVNDIPRYIKLFSSMIMGKIPEPLEFLWIHKDGTERWGEIYFCFLRRGRKKVGIQAILKDITERKRAEEKLEDSEERYRDLVEKAGVAILIDDIEGKIIYSNKRTSELYGYSPVEMKKQSIESLVHPDDVAMVTKFHKDRNQGKRVSSSYVFRGIRKNGSIRYLELDSAPYKRGDSIIGTRLYIKDITERKRAEETLQESEMKYRALFEYANDPIFLLDLMGYHIAVNEKAADMLGYSIEELIGKSIKDIVASQEYEEAIDKLKCLLEGKIFSPYERIFRKKDGTEFPVEINVSLVFDPQKKPLFVQSIVRDITERKQAEEALRDSEERFRSLVEASPDGITLTDLDGKILMCNPQTMILHGFENMEELVGKSSLEFISPEDQQKAMDNLEKTFQEGTVRNIEYALLKKDGTLYPGELSSSLILDKKGKPMAFMAVIRDITEQKQAEEALRESEERFRIIVETAPSMLLIADTKGVTKYISPNCEKITGYTQEELLGRVRWWVHEDDTPRVKKVFKSAFQEEKGGRNFEYKAVKKNGDVWHASSSWESVKDMTGKFVGVVMQTIDVTERKKAEEEREKLQAQLVQSEKMAGIGTLTSGIAHEFNNLLQIMSGHSEFAQRTKKPEDMEEALDIVANTSDRVSKIIKDLLTFSRRDALERELSSLPEVIDFVLSMTEEQLKKNNITVGKEYGRVPKIEVNQGEIQQVFLNMVTNARDAMLPKGGKLEIRIKKVKDNVEISFTDTGIGIEEENLGRVFEPFYTTKGAVGGDTRIQGIGLGLSVSYGIVQRNGGTIEVESKAGKKTTFTIRLPAKVEKAKKRIVKEKSRPKAKMTKPRSVLVVDDEEEICKMLTKWLSAEGHNVKSSTTGKKALDLVKKESFDIVFLDIVMPGIPAIDALMEIKEISPKTRVCIITGKLVDKDLWKELKADGASGYLQKPFKIENIKNCLAKIRD